LSVSRISVALLNCCVNDGKLFGPLQGGSTPLREIMGSNSLFGLFLLAALSVFFV
jgi:hypothetical protein